MAWDKQFMPLKEEKWVIDILTGFFSFCFSWDLLWSMNWKMKRTSPSFVWCCQPRSNNFNNIIFMIFYFSMLKWISYGTAEYFPVFNDITFLDYPLIYQKYAFSTTCINKPKKMRKFSAFGTISEKGRCTCTYKTVTIQLISLL